MFAQSFKVVLIDFNVTVFSNRYHHDFYIPLNAVNCWYVLLVKTLSPFKTSACRHKTKKILGPNNPGIHRDYIYFIDKKKIEIYFLR